MSWVNAGHQPALIRDSKGFFKDFESKSPPLGVIKQKNKLTYFINREKLNGKRFYAFTDGLSESLNLNLEELGIEGAKEIINKNYNSNLEIELNSVSKEVINNSKKNILVDDLTMLVIGK